MLAGVGGKTVAELKERMSHAELLDWIAYVRANGPLNPMLRFDAAVARVGAMFTKDHSVKAFMPWPIEPEPEATLENVFALLKSASRSKRK